MSSIGAKSELKNSFANLEISKLQTKLASANSEETSLGRDKPGSTEHSNYKQIKDALVAQLVSVQGKAKSEWQNSSQAKELSNLNHTETQAEIGQQLKQKLMGISPIASSSAFDASGANDKGHKLDIKV